MSDAQRKPRSDAREVAGNEWDQGGQEADIKVDVVCGRNRVGRGRW